MTDAERKLWAALRRKQMQGCKFRKQEPIGRYIVDFVCFERRLVIELDGGQHLEREEYNRKRTCWLEGEGFKVLRFWDHEVLQEFEAVKGRIWRYLG